MKRFGYFLLCTLTLVFATVGTPIQARQPRPKEKVTVKPKPAKQLVIKDSMQKKQEAIADTLQKKDSVTGAKSSIAIQLYVADAGGTKQDTFLIIKPVKHAGNEYIFYLLAGLILILGFIRFMFPKYFGDLFGLFFKVTFKQKAVRERLLESTLPSMLLNALFFISGGFFLSAISGYYHWQVQDNFWYSLGFWILLLIVIYGLKWVLLQTMGWLFQMQEASSTYSFIVFLVNKVLGVMLLPVVVLMMLGPVGLQPVLVTIVLFLLAILFIYRYVISYPGIRASVRVNQFHFFLYLCAFEVVPLLIVYKGLAMRLSSAT